MSSFKKYLSWLSPVALVLTVCCNEDPSLPLTPNLVMEVLAYDLDNNGNSSDIRVDFEVENNLNVLEYRIMVIPSTIKDSFHEDMAASTPEASYFEVNPIVFDTEYSIKRLPGNILDVNGNPIQNDLEYVVAVLVFGTGNQQLSELSKSFTLKDQGIYAGVYDVTMGDFGPYNYIEVEWQIEFKPRYLHLDSIELVHSENLNYSGTIWGVYNFEDCQRFDQGQISFSVSNNEIDAFFWDAFKYSFGGPIDPVYSCDEKFPKYGKGIIVEEINFKIDYGIDENNNPWRLNLLRR